MDMELECEIQKRLHKYYKKLWITYGIIVLDIVYLIYMFVFKLGDDSCFWVFGGIGTILMNLSVFATYAAVGFGACLVKGYAALDNEKILYEECDPILYEGCMMRIKRPLFKNRANCALAIARYYQGDSDRAYNTLMQIRPEKLKKTFALNYYLILSAIYFERGMGDQVPELEQACKSRLSNNAKGQKLFRHLCASNNLIRAMANKDYEAAFGFLKEMDRISTLSNYKLYQVLHSFHAAEIYANLGEKESAKMNLDFVIKEGNRLCVREKAKEMRKSMEESQI